MSLLRVRRAVDEVVADLLAPLRDGSLPGLGQWRLLSWDAEQGVNLTLARGADLVLVELEPRDEERPCYARTERFNLCARHPFDATRPLSATARAVVDRVIAMIAAREDRLPDLRATVSRRAEVRELEVDRVIVAEGAGHYYINPYVGCMIGCEFCYVAPRADLSRALEGLPRLPWGRYVDVKVNAAEVLRREIGAHRPGLVRLSPILTDPYQPLERRYHVSRGCLEVLLEAGFAPVVLTRGAAVVEDLDLLRRFPRAAVGFSIPSDDDRMRLAFEPGADPVEDRLAALEACRAAGVRTFVVVQPLLPMNVARLVAQLKPLVAAVRVDRMYGIPAVRHLYEAANVLWAAEDDFFDRTIRELRAAFAAAAVPFDEMDDMSGLVGAPTPARGRPRRSPRGAAPPAAAASPPAAATAVAPTPAAPRRGGAPRPKPAPRRGPRALVRVGWSCNNRCSFCRCAPRRAEAVAAADVARALDEAGAAGLAGVVLSGGEPTMCRELPMLVRRARGHGLAVELVTNGRLLAHPPVVARLAAAGVARVTVSLHGPPAVHDALTRADAFAQSHAAVRNAVAAGLPTTVATVVTRDNLAHLDALVDLLAPAAPLRLLFALVRPEGAAAERSLPTLAEAVPAVAAACRRALATGSGGLTPAHAGLPWCLLPGLEDLGTSRGAEAIDREWRGAAEGWRPLVAAPSHPEACAGCALADRCVGVDAAYLAQPGCPPLRPRSR